MAKPRQFLVLVAVFVLAASGCASPRPKDSPLMVTSPVMVPSQSPLPVAAALSEGPLFTINLPVKAGDTVVRGTGGPGVPLRVVNVTQMASELGQGQVGPDGKFEIQLNQSMTASERIGLMLGDLTGTNFQEADFQRGPGYVDTPFIGVVFTSTLVIP